MITMRKITITICLLFYIYCAQSVIAQETTQPAKVLTSEFKRIFKNIGMNTRNSGSFVDGEFLTVAGKSKQLSERYSDAFQLISFGATWCPPCREELPTLQVLSDRLNEEDAFIYHMVYVQEDMKTVALFVNENEYTFSNLLDESGTIAVSNNVRGIPTTFLIDPYGNIVFQHIGGLDWSQQQIISAIKNAISTWRAMN